MKNQFCLPCLFLLAIINPLFAQNKFTNCSAAFLNNRMIVTEYSNKGKSTVSGKSTGELTVCTAEIGPEKCKAVEKIVFKVAIRGKESKTLVMYSDETFKQINIQNILKKCKKGDSIVLMTTDDQYALPHNEILVL
ncbi:hypothetical protein ACFP1I_10565 [Dyadobacter subterraneus]|uniref:Uncharacterized protein n=1 Tax=Dyadobacter subterraneus TaxID=2773304 RepID=A0ABR9WBU3_9BACT|nr:hypothetical protein [Dyadobacter subterraneus]MBE9462451.1 hypothetical protein [Dyadobacter subterraneus]